MFIYKIINQINKKIYIGKTTLSIAERWQQHLYESFNENFVAYTFYFHRAVRKYGPENFTIEELEYVDTEDKLNEREKYWIAWYKDKVGKNMMYNIAEGGNGGITRGVGWHHTEESKKKMSEHHNYNSNINRPKHTEETKRKISEANTGIHNGMYGKHHETSELTRQKISLANTGRKLSDEHKKKIRESHIGKGIGKISINKNGIVKYIQPDMLSSFLAAGWVRGTGRFKK